MVHTSHLKLAEMTARRSYGKLVALLARRTNDVAAAEDALSEAFTAALNDWPRNGCPANPEAWLLTVARRKAIDAARRHRPTEALEVIPHFDETPPIPDERLAMLFACAHPAIDPTVRAPLMLQVALGLDAKQIAQAFLTSPAAMGKRLVRAKLKIREARIPLKVPEASELPHRLQSVLDAIYAAYSEGWSDPTGTDPGRRDLPNEAIFLAGLLTELLPNEPEPLGLLSLMLHCEARRQARRTPVGDFVPFADQDTNLWDWDLIREAEAALAQATKRTQFGRYQTEAAIQSAHVYRRHTGMNNWDDIVQLYDMLLILTDSAVVAVNRALALAERDGLQPGLDALNAVTTLDEYQPYQAARAELLSKSGHLTEARKAYELAIGLASDPAIRRFLQTKLNMIG